MKTWRERIQEARDRGRFSEEDIKLWRGVSTCLVGETVASLFGQNAVDSIWLSVNFPKGSDKVQGLQKGILDAMWKNDFDFVEQRLDEIEDSALRVKRERMS